MKRISINLLLTISALILIICMISGCTTVIRTEDPWVLVESDSFISDFLPGEENTTNAFGGLVGQETYDDFRFVAQGDWVYYHAPTRNIYKMPIDGSEGDQICLLTEEEFKMQIAENFPDLEEIIYYPGCLDLCVIGDWLYWASENGSIWRMRTDGEELTLLARNRLPDSHHLRKLYYYYYGGRHFIIYKDWIYYADQHQDKDLLADALEAHSRRQLPVDNGAHDAADVVQGHQHDQRDHQPVHAAQEISQPSAQRGDGDLDLRPDQINGKIPHSRILLVVDMENPPSS